MWGVDLAQHPSGIQPVVTDDCVRNSKYVYIVQYVRAIAGQHCTENSSSLPWFCSDPSLV